MTLSSSDWAIDGLSVCYGSSAYFGPELSFVLVVANVILGLNNVARYKTLAEGTVLKYA